MPNRDAGLGCHFECSLKINERVLSNSKGEGTSWYMGKGFKGKNLLLANFNKQQIATGSETIYPPASKSSREVANLTERKNPHTLVYGVK